MSVSLFPFTRSATLPDLGPVAEVVSIKPFVCLVKFHPGGPRVLLFQQQAPLFNVSSSFGF